MKLAAQLKPVPGEGPIQLLSDRTGEWEGKNPGDEPTLRQDVEQLLHSGSTLPRAVVSFANDLQ